MNWPGMTPEQMARMLRKAAIFLGFPYRGPWSDEMQLLICECIIGNPEAENICLTDDLCRRARAAYAAARAVDAGPASE